VCVITMCNGVSVPRLVTYLQSKKLLLLSTHQRRPGCNGLVRLPGLVWACEIRYVGGRGGGGGAGD